MKTFRSFSVGTPSQHCIRRHRFREAEIVFFSFLVLLVPQAPQA